MNILEINVNFLQGHTGIQTFILHVFYCFTFVIRGIIILIHPEPRLLDLDVTELWEVRGWRAEYVALALLLLNGFGKSEGLPSTQQQNSSII